MAIEEHVLLAPFTTFRLGGPARYFARAQNIQEIVQAFSFAKEKALKILILGGGSNMLVGETGFNGLVIKIELKGMEREGNMIVADAGESWDALVVRAVSDGLWGLENLSGIPGTVGAAPIQNIGAYGAEVKDTLLWVEAYDRDTGEVIQLQNKECEFGYRTSRFKREPEHFVILRAAFSLKKQGTPNTSYKDLFGAAGLTLAEIRQKVLLVRAGKFPDLTKEGTAGSFFLNPVVSPKQAAELSVLYPLMPQFSAEGGIKIPLAWLLDNALQLKGLSVGGARLFECQPLVIAVSSGANSRDVAALAQKVAELVQNKLNISIEPEVRIIF